MAEVHNAAVRNALDRLAARDESGFLDAFAPNGFVDDGGSLYRGREEQTFEFLVVDGLISSMTIRAA